MAENSNIEWCHHTFNPWMGCTKVSEACKFCYAEVQTGRFKQVGWGPAAARKLTSGAYWKQPYRWDARAYALGERQRVFCASLADVFDDHHSIAFFWRNDLWRLISETRHLDWLLLTKRPENIAQYLPDDWGSGYPNVWLGTTVENQQRADERIPELLKIPAKVHFLSCEPLLGQVNLSQSYRDFLKGWDTEPECCGNPQIQFDADEYGNPVPVGQECCGSPDPLQVQTHKLDWIICGGESAPDDKRRDMNPMWARSLRDQCQAAGVPFLFKQHSGRNQKHIKSLGRVLDGVVHDGYPEVAA